MKISTYNKAVNVIKNSSGFEDKQLHINFILAAGSCDFEHPYLLERLFELLEDGSIDVLKTSMQESLIRLAYRFNKSYENLEELLYGFDKYVRYTSENIYYVHLESGERVATESEIANGVEELFTKKSIYVDENTYNIVNTLGWAFTGSVACCYNMGKDPFIKGNIPKNFIELLQEVSNDLLRALVATESKDSAQVITKKLRELKKKGKYVYPKVARDEIIPDITLQSVVNGLKAKIPKDTADKLYLLCLDIIRTKQKTRGKYSPKQVALLKSTYEKLLKTKSSNSDLYTKCLELLKARDSKTLSSDEFVFKILSTVSKNNYTYASEAQLRIIDEAYAKLDTITRTAKGAEGIFSQKATVSNTIYNLEVEDDGDEIKTLDLSDMLGQGLFSADILEI